MLEIIVAFLSSQSPSTLLTIAVIYALYELRVIRRSVRVSNHNSTMIVRALLKNGLLKPEDIKDVTLA